MSDRVNNLPTDRPDWWHVDSKDRLIGWMWPEDFKITLDSIWGSRQGIKNFAIYSGLARTTVERYCNGKQPVPRHIVLLAMALTGLVDDWRAKISYRARTKHFPVLTAEWLPKNGPSAKLGVDPPKFR